MSRGITEAASRNPIHFPAPTINENRDTCLFISSNQNTNYRSMKYSERKVLSKKNQIYATGPFFDDEVHIVRAGGPLANGHYGVNLQFAITIPKKSEKTEILIREHLTC